jgi:TonB-linked SusC/RagA family outer membrane protein
MNRNNMIRIYSLLFFVGALLISVAVNAQEKSNDKNTQKVDLGFGVEQSVFLTTASTATISGEELQQTSAISLSDALYGRLLGLSAFQNGGFVGDEGRGASLNIRGYHSYSDVGILVLVDGYKRPIDRLTVEEVESVTVLKDAAALAMLGPEAINGAILVKTKRGSIDKTHVKVGYSHKFTFGQEFADMLDGYEYANVLNKARANDGLSPTYSQEELDLFKSGQFPGIYPNVNWKDMAFRNAGSENRANISVTGGSEKVQYYTMLDYTGSTGLLNAPKQSNYDPQLKYSKANIRSNVDVALTSTTKMSVNILGMFIETNQPAWDNANAISWYVYKTPASAFPYKTKDGMWGGNETYGDGNVAAKIQDVGFAKTHQRQLWANAKLTQDLGAWVKGLSFAIGADYDNASILTEQRYKGHQYGFDYFMKGFFGNPDSIQTAVYGNKQENLDFAYSVTSQWRSYQSYVGLYYKTSFTPDDHFSASVVYSAKNSVNDGQAQTFYRANWMGNFHYDYQNKYVADLVLAEEGSNRSYPAKWSFSPILSLGYIYANHPDGVLTYGKVRASGGIQHTDYLPYPGSPIWRENWADSHGQFIVGPGYGQSWGNFISSFATTNFSKEAATKFNLGTDIRLLNALDIALEGFYEQRSHIMVSATLKNSYVAGIPSAYDDVGGVKSYGVEASAHFTKKIAKDFYANASAMVTWSKDQVTNYIENPVYPNNSVIGSGVGEAWGLIATGFYKDQDDINNSLPQEFSQVRPGDIKYKDVNNDGVINQYDAVKLGNSQSYPYLNYAFNLGLEYKGFGINAWFQGTGDYMSNLIYVDGVWGVISNNRNLSRDYYDNSWDVAGASARYPRFTTQSNPNNEQASTIWIQNFHFLKMRDCEVYYKFSQKTLQSLRIAGAKLYVQGQNLLSIDNVAAMDAENLSTSYPVPKSINAGLQITF